MQRGRIVYIKSDFGLEEEPQEVVVTYFLQLELLDVGLSVSPMHVMSTPPSGMEDMLLAQLYPIPSLKLVHQRKLQH